MMQNVPTTFQGETLESFKERIKNGTGRTVKYTNYFAQLNTGGRVTISGKAPVVQRKKRINKEERLAILLALL